MSGTALCLILFAQVDVSEHLALGNPSRAEAYRQDDKAEPNNTLFVKPQYALSYNERIATPNWVSWRCAKEWLGDADRSNDFRVDEAMPATWYRATPKDYTSSGFDRGHLCPAADRAKDSATMSETFLMSNMMPQSPRCNRMAWMRLESHCRDLVKAGNELYVVAGPAGCGGFGGKGYRERLGERVVVPAACWKVIVVIPDQGRGAEGDVERITEATSTIAVILPNSQELDTDWKKYRVSIHDIEEVTGYDFLSAVRPSIQDAIEALVNQEE